MENLSHCLHLVDASGRHYVFNISQEPLVMFINQEQMIWSGQDNNLQAKFVDMYHKLMVEKQSLCVLTPNHSIMLHADKITGIQLKYELGI